MLIDPLVYEEWKDIDFFDIKHNQYMISNFGNVFSKVTERIMRPAISNGYLTVQLSTNSGTRKTFYIHRLVAIAFIPNPNSLIYTEVNHKDLRRNNNFYLNLEWVTKLENIEHEINNIGHNIPQETAKDRWGNGHSMNGSRNGMAKLSEESVRTMLSKLEQGASYKEAILAAGLEPTLNMLYNLSHIARGHRWKSVSKDYNIPKIIPH